MRPYSSARLTPILRAAWCKRHKCSWIGCADNVTDSLRRGFGRKPSDDVCAELLNALRSLGEQCGDHRLRIARAVDSYLDPGRRVSSQSSRVWLGSRAQRLLHFRPESFRSSLERSNLNLAEAFDQTLLFLDQRVRRVKLQSDVKVTDA